MTYQICKRCVMDTSDPEIVFDNDGICSHCHTFDSVTKKNWFPNDEGRRKLEKKFDKIKKQGKHKEYDCIVGLSGGIDSSYLALIINDYGLRPLVVHVDAGWNSELAVCNIEKIVNYCDFDLFTHVVDWEEMRDLQLAYLKSGVSNQDVPQDHAFFAALYNFAVKHKIHYVMHGGNIATESIFLKSWLHSAMDESNLIAIHKTYGEKELEQFQTIGFFKYYVYYPYIKRMKILKPLNYLPYNKEIALNKLKETIGYKEYGRKHGESLFTRFYQNHYLPVRFGFDKRRLHLSSLILSGQITRKQAMEKLEEPLYDPNELVRDKEYISKKLGITVLELENYIDAPKRDYSEFKNWDMKYESLKSIQLFLTKIRSVFN